VDARDDAPAVAGQTMKNYSMYQKFIYKISLLLFKFCPALIIIALPKLTPIAGLWKE
jgi:hypothetical protein